MIMISNVSCSRFPLLVFCRETLIPKTMLSDRNAASGDGRVPYPSISVIYRPILSPVISKGELLLQYSVYWQSRGKQSGFNDFRAPKLEAPKCACLHIALLTSRNDDSNGHWFALPSGSVDGRPLIGNKRLPPLRPRNRECAPLP